MIRPTFSHSMLNRCRIKSESLKLACWLSFYIIQCSILPLATTLAYNHPFLTSHAVSKAEANLFLLALSLIIWVLNYLIVASIRGLNISWIKRNQDYLLCSLFIFPALLLFDKFFISPSNIILVLLVFLIAILFFKISCKFISAGYFIFIAGLIFQLIPLFLAGANDKGKYFSSENIQWLDKKRPDIIMIIADELSADMLFNSSGVVRDNFPNLRYLQNESTTYTNAYATANHTVNALPLMLNGVTGTSNNFNISAIKASSGLLNWLEEKYSVVSLSFLYGSHKNRDILEFTKDVFAIYGKFILPHYFSEFFPDTSARWRGFWSNPDKYDYSNVNEFIKIHSATKGPRFILWHTLFTHIPYYTDFEGKSFIASYLGASNETPSGALLNESMVPIHRRMALAQVIEFDRRIGQLIDYLKSRDEWNKTAIVFTSDHGRSFAVNNDFRQGDNIEQRWGEVGHIPLLIKPPTTGRAEYIKDVRSNAQIASTILEIAGAELNSEPPILLGLNHKLKQWPIPLGRDLEKQEFHLWPEHEANYWFNYKKNVYISPWTSEIMHPKKGKEFHTGAYSSYEFLPDSAEKAFGELSKITSGINFSQSVDSSFSLFVFNVNSGKCIHAKGDGMVTSNQIPVGTVAWQGNKKGWAILPSNSTLAYEFWCFQFHAVDDLGAKFDFRNWKPLSKTPILSMSANEISFKPSETGESGLFSPKFPVRPNQKISTSVNIRRPPLGKAYIRLAWYDESGNFLYLTDIENLGVDAMPCLTWTGIAPKKAASFTLNAYYEGSPNDTIYITSPLSIALYQ